MFRRRNVRADRSKPVPVPTTLPPLKGMDVQSDAERRQRRRVLRWTVGLAAAATLMVLFVLTLAGLGIYSGLKERSEAARLVAQEHYAAGLRRLETGEYELAVAELELAMRYDPGLPGLEASLLEAQALALGQAPPTSETRLGAIDSLYRQGVKAYEAGELEEAVAAFEELRGLASDYQSQNVQTMLLNAHYQLGLDAVREDLLDEASVHFEAVLALPGGAAEQRNAQDQLNLLGLYRAAVSRWGQDWSATIQALNGLYTLAPEYKDVRTRLHDAHALYAQAYADQGKWCEAQEEYGLAAQVFPLEDTVDRRDDAAIQCQTVALALTPEPTARVVPTRKPAATPTAGPATKPVSAAAGRIIYPGIDSQSHVRGLYLLDLSQGVPRLLLEDACQPAISPDGTRLAFRNLEPNHQELGILELSSGNISEMTHNVEDSTPTWSPGADQIVFASNRESDRIWRMYVISPQSFRGEGNYWGFGQMPSWAGDGSEIAYHGCDLYFNNCALWVMEPGGFNQARLTTDPSDTSPSWKPDASQVAFVSSRTGNWEIYAVDVASGVERRLTNHPAADVAPAWSPNGRQLAFLSNRDGVWSVYVMDLKSGQAQRLTATGEPFPDPVSERLVWAP